DAQWRIRGRNWRVRQGASAYPGGWRFYGSIVMHVNFLLFEGLTQLDMTGPYEVLSGAPGFTVDFVAKTRDPVRSDRGLCFVPTQTIASAPPCDLLVVPGGPGTDDAIVDPDWVAFTRRQGLEAQYVFGICT